jgi:hypothetical protein
MRELFIAALGPALVLFISEFFRHLHTKNEQEERFFYEMYPKRLELYEDILKETGSTDIKQDLSAPVLKEKSERISLLVFRGVIYGQSAVISALLELEELYNILFKAVEAGAHPLDESVQLSVARLPVLCKMILEFIREESGKYVVDKKIFKFFKEFEAELDKSEKKRGYRRNRKNDKYNLYRRWNEH